MGYAIASLGLSLSVLLSTGDLTRFVTGLIRLAIGIAMFAAVDRGSTGMLSIIIGLFGLAAVIGTYDAVTLENPAIDAHLLAWMFVVVFGGVGLRMATSQELWDYVRSRQAH